MSQISSDAMSDMLSENLNYIYPVLLDIDHPATAEVYHFCNNNEDIIFNGTTYQHFPFEPTLAGEDQQKAQLQITNVDGQIIQLLRETQKSIQVTFRIARLTKDNNPITDSEIEFGPVSYQTRDYSADAQTINISLSHPEDFLNAQFPRYKFTPSSAPAMFE